MSVSTQAAPRQMSLGRFPSALAIIALAIVIVAAVALVAANVTKTATPATSSGFGHGPGDWYYATTTDTTNYGESLSGVWFYDHGASGINEPGQSRASALYNDHGASGINESRAAAAPESYKGPYYNNGVLAVPPAAASKGAKAFDGAMPYAGPFYYNGTTPYLPFAAGKIAGGGALGYPPFGATYSTRTIDSPYVAPRPRNQ